MILTGPLKTGVLSAIGATALQLITTTYPLTSGVTLSTPSTNTDTLYFGVVGVTTSTGFPLPKSTSITIPIADLSTLYIVSAGTGDSVNWFAN